MRDDDLERERIMDEAAKRPEETDAARGDRSDPADRTMPPSDQSEAIPLDGPEGAP